MITYRKALHLTCDNPKCGHTNGMFLFEREYDQLDLQSGQPATRRGFLRKARYEGWIYNGDLALCPRCRSEGFTLKDVQE